MRWFFSVLMMVLCFDMMAQNNTRFTILSDRPDATTVQVNFGDVTSSRVETSKGWMDIYRIDKGNPILNSGAPHLPQVSFSLLIPDQATTTLEVLDAKFTELQGVDIAPSKGKIFRNQNPNDVNYVFGQEYNTNAFYPTLPTYTSAPYTFRDFQGQTIHLHPLLYNPVTKTLRIYSEMKIKVHYTFSGTLKPRPEQVDETFNTLYKNHFLNYAANKTRYSPIKQTGSILVVTPGMYLSAMEPYIQWKKQKGFSVYVCNTDTLSGGINEANLKNTAKWYYQNKQIAYMLLVGDHSQVTAVSSPVTWVNSSYGPCSDLANAYITNNDHYPEFIVGRFSGESVADIATQVERTIAYEKYPNTASNWFQHQMGIASSQGDADSDDGQLDFEHLCDIMDSNKNQYYYVNNKGFFDGTQTLCGDDANSPDQTMIANQINSGVGLINYCGHGTTTNWSTSVFSNIDVNALNNEGKLPFIFSTACSNGFFMNATCFGEAWLRAQTNDGKPKGAVAAIMSSIVQDWNPPMEGQDEMNAVMRGARSNNLRTTFGAIVTSGFMAGNDKYNTFADPDGGNAITDTWIIFGDPSLEVKTKQEGVITCSHSGYIQQQSTIFHVGCPVEGATITLYYQNEKLASTTVSGGAAIFYFDPVTVLDSIIVTATKQNWTPYIGKVDVKNYAVGTSQLAASGFSIYPIPAQDELFIHSQFQTNGHIAEVLDVTGRVMLRSDLTDQRNRLQVSALVPGNYILRITGESKTVSSLFTKQ